MVSERKREAVRELSEELGKYPIIGMLDMFKLPGKQLQDIRDSLRGKAVIKMVKKNVMKIAIENSKIQGLETIEKHIKKQPALLLSDMNPFELAKIIQSSKSSAPAKPGDVASRDITIKEGPTSLKPGPVIGELQRVKIPAGVEGDKIVIKKDTVMVRGGEEVTKNVADVLMKLGVEPMEISLNLIAVFDQGTIYTKDILFVPAGKYENDLISAHKNAFNLAMSVGLLTPETVPLLIAKAGKEALSLSMAAEILTKDTIGNIFAKAKSEADALKSKMGNLEPPKRDEGGDESPAKEGNEKGKQGNDDDKKVKKEG